MHNYKSIPVDVQIAVRLGGRATEASHEGAIALGAFNAADWDRYRGSPAVNNSSTVRWKITLKPDEGFKSTIKYCYYTRH